MKLDWLVTQNEIYVTVQRFKIMRSAWKKTPDKFGGGLLAAKSTKLHLFLILPPSYISLLSLASHLFIPERCGFILNESSGNDFTRTDSLFFWLKRKMPTTSALKFASTHNEDKRPPDRNNEPPYMQVHILSIWAHTHREVVQMLFPYTVQDVARCTLWYDLYLLCNNKSVDLRVGFRSNFKMLEACR